MLTSVLDAALACVVGAVELERNADGVVLHRVPGRALGRVPDPMLHFMTQVPSGIRLEMLTDAHGARAGAGAPAHLPA